MSLILTAEDQSKFSDSVSLMKSVILSRFFSSKEQDEVQVDSASTILTIVIIRL